MTYSTYEISWYDGQPIELYEFRQEVLVWRFTNAEETITLGGFDYTPIQIERSGVEQGSEMNRNNIKLTMPRDAEISSLFLASPPGTVLTLSIFRLHRGDTDKKAIWLGRVLGVEWRDSTAQLDCEPVFTSLKRPGLRRHYQLNCPHLLYGVGCYVNQLSYKLSGAVTAVNGTTVSVSGASGQADGYYDGGMLYWLKSDGTSEYRLILTHVGTDVTLSSPVIGLSAGQNVDLYPGCDHTLATCNSKFNNVDNYGGFPYIPQINPFNGTMVF